MTSTVRLRKIAKGVYQTTDGRFEIENGSPSYTSCEGPHPTRDGGYHYGGEEHEEFVWQLNELTDSGWQKVDTRATRGELASLLTAMLAPLGEGDEHEACRRDCERLHDRAMVAEGRTEQAEQIARVNAALHRSAERDLARVLAAADEPTS